MNDQEISELESQLGLKLPKKYIDFIRKYIDTCSEWPEHSRAMADRLQTSLDGLLKLNQDIRKSPARYVTAPREMSCEWPSYLFVFGNLEDYLYYVIDTRETNPRLRQVYNKQHQENPAIEDLAAMFKLFKSQHRGAWRLSKERDDEASRRAKTVESRAAKKPRPPAPDPDLITEGRTLARRTVAHACWRLHP